jgi:peptidoglycan/LPS O-acetylase OafA/YrhL
VTASTPPRSAPRLGGLDGLRALAVSTVILYHFLPQALPGGYVGVDVFFVISGFLITGLLITEKARAGRISLPRFWLRRARRLLPALALVVVLCSAAALFIGGDLLVGLGLQVLGAATFSSNWLFIAEGASYFDATTPELFRNLWSLAVEEQFYLLWPLAMLLLLRLRSRRLQAGIAVTIAVASAAAMALLAGADTTRVYYGTDTHSFGLALGAALAFALQARFRDAPAPARAWQALAAVVGALAVIGIVAFAVFLPEQSPLTTRGGLTAVAALTALAIAAATTPGGWLGRALDVAPVRWLGERSYGLYLWHWPVLLLASAALPVDAPPWVTPVMASALTIAAATLSYAFVESPIRRLGFRRAARALAGRGPATRAVASVTAVALIAATGLGALAVAVDPRAGQAEASILEGQDSLARPAIAESPRRPQPLPTGDQITAIGDSVMLAAAPALQEAFPGISIDATVSRQMSAAEEIVGGFVASGAMRPVLVLGLGTNGWIRRESLDRVAALLPPETLMVVVNIQAPRDWEPEVNQIISEFARSEREVELANWHDAIQPELGLLARDQIHPGQAGGRLYADAVADALQRLAELPPLRDDHEYGDANRPV